MTEAQLKKILILGGFAGFGAAMELEKSIPRAGCIEVTVVNRENFFLFTPILHEVAASDLDLTTILRNHLVAHLEEAASECCKDKSPLLTFVVAGVKRVRVALEWTLDLISAKNLVQFQQIEGPYNSEKGTAENGEEGAKLESRGGRPPLNLNVRQAFR